MAIVDVDSDGHIKITNTMDDCMPHKIRLIAKNGASFTMGGSTSTNEIVFGFDSDIDPGFAPAKLKAQYSETFQVNSNSVVAGQPYIEVYYNKEPEQAWNLIKYSWRTTVAKDSTRTYEIILYPLIIAGLLCAS